MTDAKILQDIADNLRIHSIRMTTEAGSGHPTSCMSMAEIMSVLFFVANMNLARLGCLLVFE